jgi:hypothetical protein
VQVARLLPGQRRGYRDAADVTPLGAPDPHKRRKRATCPGRLSRRRAGEAGDDEDDDSSEDEEAARLEARARFLVPASSSSLPRVGVPRPAEQTSPCVNLPRTAGAAR